jgi:hypothetical protein
VLNFFTEINCEVCKHNAKQDFQISSPQTGLKFCHVRRDMGKSERVEGQECLHSADGPTGY